MCFAKKFYQVFCVKIVCQVLCSKRAKGQEQAQPGTTFHSWISVTLCKLKIEILGSFQISQNLLVKASWSISRNNSLRILKTTQETSCVAKQEAHEATFRSLLWLTHWCPGRKQPWLCVAFFAEGKKQWKGNHFEKLESLYSHGRLLVVLGSPVAVTYKSQYFWLSALCISYYFSPYLLLLFLK